MGIEYYQLPLKLGDLMSGKMHAKVSLSDSIKQHLHLIITTSFGEMQFDENFGCSLWDDDFDNLTAINKIREKTKNSILYSINKYETRIENIKLDLQIREAELSMIKNGKYVKKRLDLLITANICSTNLPLEYRDSFYTGPLSFY
jgi:phage baseplate assembly protein W